MVYEKKQNMRRRTRAGRRFLESIPNVGRAVSAAQESLFKHSIRGQLMTTHTLFCIAKKEWAGEDCKECQYDDTVCKICRQGSNENHMLLCGDGVERGYDRGFHTYCVGLHGPLPVGDWFCRACVGQTSSDNTSPSVALKTSLIHGQSSLVQ